MKLFEVIELMLNVTGTIVSIVSVMVSIVSVIISTILAFKVERLKTELEIEKNKAILNDSKVRKAYEDFISAIVDISNKEKNGEIDEGIKNFTKNSLLFSGENTIHAINKYKTNTPKDRKEEIHLVENILFAMRQDLGVSNDGIKYGDLMQFLVKSDISSILNSKKK